MGNINQNDKKSTSRYKSREQAFILCFERLFTDYSIDDIFENTFDSRDIQLDEYAINVANGIEQNIEEIDKYISDNMKKGWKISRIAKVSLSILRVAIYEMLYVESVPVSVSINEAVELSKKYSTPEDSAFVNGVLGAVSKVLESKDV